MNKRLAVLLVIKMIYNKTLIADNGLVLSTKFKCHFFWMNIAKNHWVCKIFFNLVFNRFIRNKLVRFLISFVCTMIRVTE